MCDQTIPSELLDIVIESVQLKETCAKLKREVVLLTAQLELAKEKLLEAREVNEKISQILDMTAEVL